MAAPIVHFEIGCKNLESTQKFFGELFGWEYESFGPAAMLKNIGGPGKDGIGGHINCLGHEPHQYVTVYALVDDLQKTLDHAAKLGGKRSSRHRKFREWAHSPGFRLPKATSSGSGKR